MDYQNYQIQENNQQNEAQMNFTQPASSESPYTSKAESSGYLILEPVDDPQPQPVNEDQRINENFILQEPSPFFPNQQGPQPINNNFIPQQQQPPSYFP